AAVQVSMVGFDDGSELMRCLDGSTARTINANLTAELNLAAAAGLKGNQGISFLGTFKVGSFDIDRGTAQQLLNAPVNANGRPNSDVVSPWANGLDITRRPRDMWIINFRDMSEEEASLYEAPFEYVKRVVKPERDLNRRPRRKAYWWQHGETS